ncbi:MAG: galactose-1-epimerase [Gammaproteobacteria bacterium]|nr:galactose-1-epimerase [Gammaproteobacteria bacterium]
MSSEQGRGRTVRRFELMADRLRAEVVDLGARLAALEYRLDSGETTPMIIALPDAASVVGDRGATGAVCGRYANRIRGGSFELDGVSHVLEVNENGNTLHGGPRGFMTRTWEARDAGDHVELRLHSQAGDQGFPGALDVRVTYAVVGASLTVSYEARTDAPTVINLTNHAYFTLGCAHLGNALIDVQASTYLPVDDAQLPVGPWSPVAGTPFDLREPQTLDSLVGSDAPQIVHAGGVDHCFVLHATDGAAATVRVPGGPVLEVFTTEPGLQVYTANHLSPVGQAVCLETQHLPDSPNRPDYPSTTLRPGEVFRSSTTFRFSG